MSVNIVIWEVYRTTNLPVANALVNVRAATTAQPNTTLPTATGYTGANGQISFTGLADGQYDVDVTYAGVTKSYKGLTQFSGIVQPSNFAAQTGNLILASPSNASGYPSFRALQSLDLPTAILTNHYFADETTPSKILQFGLGGATAGTITALIASQTANRNITLPDRSDTLVTLGGTETLAAKTLTTPTIANFTNAPHTHSTTASGGQIVNDRCAVHHSATQNIPANTQTYLGFDTELYDTASFHVTGGGNSRLTAPRNGMYLVVANIRWATDATGYREAGIWQDGVTVLAKDIRQAGPSVNYTEQNLTCVAPLNAGQYVELRVQHNSTTTPLGLLSQGGSPPAFSICSLGAL